MNNVTIKSKDFSAILTELWYLGVVWG
jgi:hypothetical protein